MSEKTETVFTLTKKEIDLFDRWIKFKRDPLLSLHAQGEELDLPEGTLNGVAQVINALGIVSLLLQNQVAAPTKPPGATKS